MIQIKDIAFTGYPVTDMARSRAFYEGVLGLQPTMIESVPEKKLEWTEYDIGSNTLALACVKGWVPSEKGATIALEVADIDAAIAHLEKQNVRFCLTRRQTPTCQFCTILDPDNNQIMIHQLKARDD